jgi:hypothetical protein
MSAASPPGPWVQPSVSTKPPFRNLVTGASSPSSRSVGFFFALTLLDFVFIFQEDFFHITPYSTLELTVDTRSIETSLQLAQEPCSANIPEDHSSFPARVRSRKNLRTAQLGIHCRLEAISSTFVTLGASLHRASSFIGRRCRRWSLVFPGIVRRPFRCCQYFGPRKPSQIQKPILHLLPRDSD